MFHSEAISIFWQTLLCVVLTFLPSFAVCAFAIRKGARNAIWLGLLALAQIGAFGYLAFWLWFAAPSLGRVFSLCLPIASSISLALSLRTLDRNQRTLLFSLATPMALTGASALLVLSAGFLYGGFDEPLQTALTRFSHPLPGDNWLPYHFAVALRKHISRPHFGVWISSDRPPLQMGIYLSEFVYIRGQKGYEILSAILQSLWIYALYLLLLSCRANLRAIRPVLITCLLSGFVFLNTLFVWPKLLAAAYLLAFSTVVLSSELLDVSRQSSKAVLGGALLAFGLLAHTGSVFSVLGLGVALFALRFRTALNRRGFVIVLTCFFLCLPWTLYQKYYDPPGDYLLKGHLAGMITPNLSFGQAMAQAYGNLTPVQIADQKLSNLETVYSHPVNYWLQVSSLFHPPSNGSGATLQVARDLRGTMFFYFVPSLGFLMFGPFALLAGFRRQLRSKEWKTAIAFYICVFFTLILWCVIMFGPATTVVHQGSYAANLMAISAAVLALYTVSPWLAWLMACGQITINFLLYGVFMDTVPTQQLQVDTLGLLIIALLTVVFLLSRLRSSADLLAPAMPGYSNRLAGYLTPLLQSRERILMMSSSRQDAFHSRPAPRGVWTLRLIGLGMLILVLMVLRRPDVLTNPQFWAEDAVVFFNQQITSGFAHVIFEPYSGYLHVVPRFVAFAASFLPVKWAPFAYNSFALLISSLCCSVFAGPWCRNLLRSDGLRAACCLIVATGLPYGSDLIGTLANIQWFLALAAAVLIFSSQREQRPRWLWIVLALLGSLIALSAPETFVFVPFLVWQSVTYSGWKRLAPVLMIATLLIQLCVADATAQIGGGVHFSIVDLFLTTTVALLSRPITATLLGHSYLVHHSAIWLISIWAVALILVSVWLTKLSVSLQEQRRRILWGACYVGLVATLAPMILGNFIGMFASLDGLRYVAGERYFLLSAAVFVFLVALTIDHRLARASQSLKVGLLLAIFLLGIINNFRVPRYKDKHWSSYAPAVERWSDARRNGGRVSSVTIPINPQGWTLTLPGNSPPR